MSAKLLAEIRQNIAEICQAHGRSASTVNLLAVSKTHSADKIEPLLQAGHRQFAENRVQEAEAKWPDLRARYTDVELHLIGALQSNKAATAVRLFDVIHSLDREKLAQKLAQEMQAQAKDLPLFIQVNIGDEPQKAGVSLADLNDFYAYCHGDLGLKIIGLMAIPPAEEEPSPYFALLQKRAAELRLPHISAGMSADYEVALLFGADYLRIGSALFGERA